LFVVTEKVAMQSEDTVSVPEPTHALFMPTTAMPALSSNLAWSDEDQAVEPEPFEPEKLRSRLFDTRRQTFNWARWIGPALLVMTVFIATIWMLIGLLNSISPGVNIQKGTNQQTPGGADPGWREPPWGLPLPNTPSSQPTP
jgi:hypothetical protein